MTFSARALLKYLGYLFVVGLLALAGGFFAVRFGWTNVAGETDPRSESYITEAVIEEKASLPAATIDPHGINFCKIKAVAVINPVDAAAIFKAYQASGSETLLRRMLFAFSLRLPEPKSFTETLTSCEQGKNPPATQAELTTLLKNPIGKTAYRWQTYEPWQIIRQALIKDKPTIDRAAAAAGIQPRMLVSVAIVEQLRLYYTQRELFEKFFKPLKILATANKMAWGVMSIKEPMAIATESHLKDETSDFYLGQQYEHLLDFSAGSNSSSERYRRLTNERDHYYSFLYGALMLRQLENQWAKAGFELYYRPEILATLFNIGFNRSNPKAAPAVGGSTIVIEGKKYYFGSLAYEFYYSGELMDEFPYK